MELDEARSNSHLSPSPDDGDDEDEISVSSRTASSPATGQASPNVQEGHVKDFLISGTSVLSPQITAKLQRPHSPGVIRKSSSLYCLVGPNDTDYSVSSNSGSPAPIMEPLIELPGPSATPYRRVNNFNLPRLGRDGNFRE